jgi:hypothetical protein
VAAGIAAIEWGKSPCWRIVWTDFASVSMLAVSTLGGVGAGPCLLDSSCASFYEGEDEGVDVWTWSRDSCGGVTASAARSLTLVWKKQPWRLTNLTAIPHGPF